MKVEESWFNIEDFNKRHLGWTDDSITHKHTLRKKKKYECAFFSCNNPTQRSHLLQRNGILDRIATNGHVWMPTEKSYYDIKNRFKFDARGIKNDALAYPVFCNDHDKKLFSSIEDNPIDNRRKMDNLLLGYRAQVTERRKNEILRDISTSEFIKSILDKKPQYLINSYCSESKSFNKPISNSLIRETKLFSLIRGEFPIDCFKTIYRELPRIEICSAAVFSFIEFVSSGNYYECPVYFSMIPYKDRTVVSISYINPRAEKLLPLFNTQRTEKFLKFVSDILLARVEDWAVSKRFYRKYIRPNEHEIIKQLSQNHLLNFKAFNSTIGVNLFDNYKNS